MHFFPKLNITSIRHCSHYSSLRKLPKLRKIPNHQRPKAILQAQKALTEYFYNTRSLPFSCAENISNNALVSLCDLIAKVDFSPQTFSSGFSRFLRYHPIDEFDFFFESIGIPYSEIKGFVRPNEFFLSQNANILNVACVLCDFGFAWNKLGRLYVEKSLIFDEDPDGIPEEVFAKKFEFFSGMGASKEDIGLVLLQWPEILSYDLESHVFSVEGFLTSIGLSSMKLDSISWEFPFVLGKNKLENLPCLLRAIDLHEWFFEKIMNGDHHLLVGVNNGSLDYAVEKEFKKGMEKIKSRRKHRGTMERLNFLLGIGFGQNLVTLKVLSSLHGSRAQLQKRFNLLLNLGIKDPDLCKIVNMRAKAFNQNPAMLEEKVNHLQFGLGCSLQFLDVYPGFLCFDLENRIKPRYAIHQWLFKNGLVRRKYCITSMISPSEKTIIARLYNIHPSIPKQWLENPSRFNSESLEQE
ncbi:hypothetical protein Sjap_004481 [Stephania japonica]|uniref:Transcription termination factor MTEF18, mitochondrial n=1 Tax=Stephania japonica TaxID=461633 RepID=A0AAP0PH20_9MAGN